MKIKNLPATDPYQPTEVALPVTPPPPGPDTEETYKKMMNTHFARALSLADSAKDLTGVLEAGTEWYKVAYAASVKAEGWGADLPQNGATRHGG